VPQANRAEAHRARTPARKQRDAEQQTADRVADADDQEERRPALLGRQLLIAGAHRPTIPARRAASDPRLRSRDRDRSPRIDPVAPTGGGHLTRRYIGVRCIYDFLCYWTETTMAPDTSENTSTPTRTGGKPDPNRGHLDRYAILLDAEVPRLVHEPRPFGAFSQHELARRADAALWHSGTFQAALRADARRGQLKLRPGGFVAHPRHHDEHLYLARSSFPRRLAAELRRIRRRAPERNAGCSQTANASLPPARDWW
jgi:hypothetical protein